MVALDLADRGQDRPVESVAWAAARYSFRYAGGMSVSALADGVAGAWVWLVPARPPSADINSTTPSSGIAQASASSAPVRRRSSRPSAMRAATGMRQETALTSQRPSRCWVTVIGMV